MNKFRVIASFMGDFAQIFGVTVLLLALGHVLIGFYFPERNRIGDVREKSPVYDSMPNKTAFWTDHNKALVTHFEPYFHWRRDEHKGVATNVNAKGIRETPRPPGFQSDRKLFMFGGSTMWGTGVDDDHTIPAYMQRHFGNDFEVINYGESGYVSTQELNYLMYQLAMDNIPDVVVFYDGVNDGYAGVYSPAIPRDPENLRVRFNKIKAEKKDTFLDKVYKHSNYSKLVSHLTRKPWYLRDAEWDNKITPHIVKNATAVLDYYEANMRQVKALAREYGFEAYFFWQPHLLSMTRKVNSYEQKIIIDRSSSGLIESQRTLYELAKTRLSNRENEGVFFLGNILDTTDKPIYIDWHHMGDDGNAEIARSIYQALQGQEVR